MTYASIIEARGGMRCPVCQTCRHAFTDDKYTFDDGVLRCHRFPPQYRGADEDDNFPCVSPLDCCGEYERDLREDYATPPVSLVSLLSQNGGE